MRLYLALALVIVALARGAVADKPQCGWDTTGCVKGAWTYKGDDEFQVTDVCTEYNSEGAAWCMRPAYKKGTGSENEDWVYTDTLQSGHSESECVTDWTYYSSTGSVLEANIKVTTTAGDGVRPWCAPLLLAKAVAAGQARQQNLLLRCAPASAHPS
jgi:hypothetical protein